MTLVGKQQAANAPRPLNESKARLRILRAREQIEARPNDGSLSASLGEIILSSTCAHEDNSVPAESECCLNVLVAAAVQYMDLAVEMPPERIDYKMVSRVGMKLARDLQRLRWRVGSDPIVVDSYGLVGSVALGLAASRPQYGTIGDRKHQQVIIRHALQLLGHLQRMHTVNERTIWSLRIVADALVVCDVPKANVLLSVASKLRQADGWPGRSVARIVRGKPLAEVDSIEGELARWAYVLSKPDPICNPILPPVAAVAPDRDRFGRGSLAGTDRLLSDGRRPLLFGLGLVAVGALVPVYIEMGQWIWTVFQAPDASMAHFRLHTGLTSSEALSTSVGLLAAAATITVALAVAPRIGGQGGQVAAARRWWSVGSFVTSFCAVVAICVGIICLLSADAQPLTQSVLALIVGLLTVVLASGIDQWRGNQRAVLWREEREVLQFEQRLAVVGNRPRIAGTVVKRAPEMRKAALFTLAPVFAFALVVTVAYDAIDGDVGYMLSGNQLVMLRFYLPILLHTVYLTVVGVAYCASRIISREWCVILRLLGWVVPLTFDLYATINIVLRPDLLAKITYTLVLLAMLVPTGIVVVSVASPRHGVRFFERYGYLFAAKSAVAQRTRFERHRWNSLRYGP